jgi:DNA sulfur modification protein DndC|tara:strand:- start:20 stop:1093 length:1074 start_codon:yes stop_codon:yes gene_type:complete
MQKIPEKDKEVVKVIIREYQKNLLPWYIGYSGGKDSSSMLKLVFNALKQIDIFHKPITVLYCDTGVENPIVTTYVYETFDKLKRECEELNIPLTFRIVQPKLEDRFFVKVIGRGYPTPTNIFRWCTDKLRINPVKQLINKDEKAVILLGVRSSESEQRDRTISKHRTDNEYYLKQSGSSSNIIFSPIINHALEDVWMTLRYNELPKSIDFNQIRTIYQDAESECPTYRESKGSSCGNSRFGCWTCTVVRKDKSMGNMIENGYSELKELYAFRNWIAEFRDNIKYRCSYRRNGVKGLGPITLEGRKIILEKLLNTEKLSGLNLISKEEINRIYELWEIDEVNVNYQEKRLTTTCIKHS